MMIRKRLLAMVPEAVPFMVRKVIVSWLSLLAGILFWFSVARLLAETLTPSVDGAGTLRYLAVAVFAVAVRFGLTRLATRYAHKAAACVKGTLRTALYEKLRRLGGGCSGEIPTAELVQLSGEGVEQLESYFGSYLPQLFYAMLAPLTLLAVFWPLSPLTAIVLFLCVPLIPVAIVAVQKVARRLLGSYWDAYANLGDSFLENLQGLTTLKVYGADGARHEAMNAEAERFRQATMKVLTMQLGSVTVMDLVAYGGTALGSILCARDYAAGKVGLDGALAMILLASEFFLAMRALGSYFHVAMNGMAASDRMFRFLDLPEPPEGTTSVSGGDLVAAGLSFSYDGTRPALSGVDFTILAGSFVSVCGESGCGKSTLAALLSGRRRGYGGSLSLGGTELRDADRESLRRTVTVVSSNSYLFAGTVRQTLAEGRPDATEAEMEAVLEQVDLLGFVRAQGGLDLALTERGGNLSGGQRQRLALARALLKDSPIYIFDEATSNIDADSENQILRVIREMRGRHTVILISHRLSNGIPADEILFFRRGRLAERGTHRALLERGGAYAELFTRQQRLEQYGKEAV